MELFISSTITDAFCLDFSEDKVIELLLNLCLSDKDMIN